MNRIDLYCIVLALLSTSIAPAHADTPGTDLLSRLLTHLYDTNADTMADAGEWQAGTEKSFQHMDGNHDGSITDTELDALAKPIGKEAGEVAAALVTQLIKQLVLVQDTDKDGTVSQKEYSARATELFTQLDTNQDGSIQQTGLNKLAGLLIAK